MLEALKRMVLRVPEKTEAEGLAELVEQGQRDRQARLDAEAQAQADAEHQRRVHAVMQADAEVRRLVAQHPALAAEFQSLLVRMGEATARLREHQERIDEARTLVHTCQRELRGDALDLPPYTLSDGTHYEAIDTRAEIARVLMRR